MRVLSVFGTRPEAIKMAPVVMALEQHPDIENYVVLSGQHRDMLDQVVNLFELPVHYDLEIMRPGQSLDEIVARVLLRLAPILSDVKPDMVLVHGDTTTSMAAALCAFHAGIAVGHVEAGLRSGRMDAPFPEEGNRVITDRITRLAFAPTQRAYEALKAEGTPDAHVYVTGNTVIDALLHVRAEKLGPSARTEMADRFNLNAEDRRVILVTAHRRENFGQGMESLCRALLSLADRGDTRIILPVHRNPKVRATVERMLSQHDAIELIEPQDYLNFVYLMDRADLIISDSGGIQEEAPALGKPTLVTRDVTERPEAIEAGTVRLVGTDEDLIVRTASMLLDDPDRYAEMSNARNPFGDGTAAEQIVAAVLAWSASRD